MAEEGLIKYNIDGALDNMLAIEEHLSGSNEIPIHQWCADKHSRLVASHHLRELKEHASSVNPELANKIGEFKDKFDEARSKDPMDVNEIRQLRNEFREITGDKTLSCKDKVCSLDKLRANKSETVMSESVGEGFNWKPIAFIAGVGIFGVFLYKLLK